MAKRFAKILDFLKAPESDKKTFTFNEMELAKEIQNSLLPRNFPFPHKLEVGALYQPAEHIGGDFYDVIQIDDRKVAFIIGDISGHSIAAALFMTQCHTILKTLIKMDWSLLKVVETANEILSSIGKSDMFATLFVGVYDTYYNQLSYVNAGHPPPFLIRSAWERAETQILPITNLTAEGMALNIKPNILLEEKRIQLVNDDILLLYTDGITEAPSPSMDPLGEGKIKKVLNENKHLPASEIVEKIKSVLDEHTENPKHPHDDLAALVIKFGEKS